MTFVSNSSRIQSGGKIGKWKRVEKRETGTNRYYCRSARDKQNLEQLMNEH